MNDEENSVAASKEPWRSMLVRRQLEGRLLAVSLLFFCFVGLALLISTTEWRQVANLAAEVLSGHLSNRACFAALGLLSFGSGVALAIVKAVTFLRVYSSREYERKRGERFPHQEQEKYLREQEEHQLQIWERSLDLRERELLLEQQKAELAAKHGEPIVDSHR